MIYHQINNSNLTDNHSNNWIKSTSSENLSWISEGIALDESHDILPKPPKEVPSDQPQEIEPIPQELTQYHSAENQTNVEQ